MKGGFNSLVTVWDTFRESGAIVPVANVLLVLLLTGGAILLGLWIYLSYRAHQSERSNPALRARKKIKALRESGQLQGEFTFADAAELMETGTIRRKTLEDKIVDWVVPLEILFRSEEHGIVYQLEMSEWSKKQVASWLEVTRALDLAEISRIMEEVVLMRNVICHPDYDPEFMQGAETIGDKLWKRALFLHGKMAEIDGIAQLRAASEAHLQKNAPEMMPLPTC